MLRSIYPDEMNLKIIRLFVGIVTTSPLMFYRVLFSCNYLPCSQKFPAVKKKIPAVENRIFTAGNK